MLITLGVIGIVAAMTFPSIVAKYQKVVTVNQLKKVYSTLLQAIDRSVADHGEVSEWNLGSMSRVPSPQRVSGKLAISPDEGDLRLGRRLLALGNSGEARFS